MVNEVNKKILLLLLSGINFTYAYYPDQKWRVLKNLSREWKRIDEKRLKRSIRDLYYLDIIDKVETKDGIISLQLTKKGKLRAINYTLDNIVNKKEKWDGKWRMVAFDVPEEFKRGRDALRHKLKKIGFHELQKSIFITPYDCQREIQMLTDFFNLNKYVRFGILSFIDNENYFKEKFQLK